MKNRLIITAVLILCASAVFSQDLNQGYRKAFGSGTIIATNGEYPPVSSFNASQFEFKNGAFYINISFDGQVNLRVIPPAGKRFKSYHDQAVKEQKANLKYKKEDVFYWQLWTDRDSEGNMIEQAQKSWPKKGSDTPSWEKIGWFTTTYEGEAAGWDTVGINNGAFKENLMQYFSNAQPGQKFFITVSVGYSYIAGEGEIVQKWNPVFKRFESVESSGELGFAVSSQVCGGTIIIKENNTGN